MKCSEKWLREWVTLRLSKEQLSNCLTMSGFEVESVLPSESNTDDCIIDISITPNRGDCLSVQGMARELAAIKRARFIMPKITTVKAKNNAKLPVSIKATAACPQYIGRIISGIKANIATPPWMQHRLHCGGIRSINPIVDVTNYVMLELGQPMHAFDLACIKNEVQVRWSKQGETINLLDGTTKTLDAETLVIADHAVPLAIAGVMGGVDSSVTSLTENIFLESAYFAPTVVAKQRQHYLLNSDSAYRFERGVDPALQRLAIERATQLILTIAGGEPGPVIVKQSKSQLPKRPAISLTPEHIEKLLGMSVSKADVLDILKALGCTCKRTKQGWRVLPPTYRFDLNVSEDLIEEVARLYGYDRVPTNHMNFCQQPDENKENSTDFQALRLALSNQGYSEIISYSFVDKKLQEQLDPHQVAYELLNPISADMPVMRTHLWPGLVSTLLYNINRQQQRVRLFEIGLCFTQSGQQLSQTAKLAGLVWGAALPLQWGSKARTADFYDVKGDIENLLGLHFSRQDWEFKRDEHPGLHPGQTAGIYLKGKKIGILGALHPSIKQAFQLEEDVFLFEFDRDVFFEAKNSRYHELSKFPEVRRDLAILINETIPSDKIQDTISKAVGSWLKDIFIFDVYQGKGIAPGIKSVAFTVVLQHPTRTFVESEVVELVDKIILALKGTYGAELRS